MVNVQIEERRKAKRIRLHLPINYQLVKERAYGGSLTQDISEAGVRFTLDEFVPPKTEISLQIHFSNLPRLVNCLGEVVWTEKMPHVDRYQIGMRYVNLNEVDRKEIADLVSSYYAN